MVQSDKRIPRALNPKPTPKAGRDVVHRMIITALAVLLVSISIWCLLLLSRSIALRQDLARHQGSIDDLHRMRATLERPISDVVGEEDWPRIDELRRSSSRLKDHSDADLRAAARRLDSGLEQLHRALLYDSANAEPAATERVWDASFAVLKAVSALEDKILKQVAEIYGDLDQHWRSLNTLVIVCLLLCGSNLGLLHLAHRRRMQLEKAHNRAVELSSHDALTGLWNRDAILKMVRREIARSRRLNLPVGLVLADADRFREVNGLVGQEQGDVILQEVAWRLGSLVRPYDTMGRLGGDSFLVVLPTCDPVATANVTERLRAAINEQEVEYGLGRIEVSLSFVYLTIENPEEASLDLALHRLQEGLAELKAGDARGATLAVSDAPRATGVRSE